MSIFEVSPLRPETWPFRPPPSANACVCVCVCAKVSEWKGKELQPDDTVKCRMSPHSWHITSHAFRVNFFGQIQGHPTLRVNIIIGTVWLRNQIRMSRHDRLGGGIRIHHSGTVGDRWVFFCYSILVALHCQCNITFEGFKKAIMCNYSKLS